ncbi:PP2C family serine/threonine-protein phosphatase [Actimicrobium antarcticum]|uniref:Stp1/IreP family PP2C-type Ser/Thr phosphatase n=1 Tax=Actimicrobium antarcticum TaxID=1051899 RepID=A0ABP7SQS9_9BURK
MSQYKIEAGSGQHIGDRPEQQDRVALMAAPNASGFMLAVLADGMGGSSGGAIAAEQVIRTARELFDKFSPVSGDIEVMLRNLVREAHTIIQLSGLSTEKEPHSTMVALILTPTGTAHWAHVGDSRLYRFRGPALAERTRDHSLIERMVAQGRLDAGHAINHRLAHVLVNVLGSPSAQPFVTLGRFDGLSAGDAFLLCSDGLWHYFSDQELAEAVALAGSGPRQIAELLINTARARAVGSRGDNCTLALVKLVTPAG